MGIFGPSPTEAMFRLRSREGKIQRRLEEATEKRDTARVAFKDARKRGESERIQQQIAKRYSMAQGQYEITESTLVYVQDVRDVYENAKDIGEVTSITADVTVLAKRLGIDTRKIQKALVAQEELGEKLRDVTDQLKDYVDQSAQGRLSTDFKQTYSDLCTEVDAELVSEGVTTKGLEEQISAEKAKGSGQK